MRHNWTLLIGAFALLASCSPANRAEMAEAGAAAGGAVSLVPTFAVRIAGDSVEFMLRIANDGGAVVPLEFGTAQRYDFAVMDGSGAEVWRWSSDQMFAQAVGTERLEVRGLLEYRAVWAAAGRRGEFRAEAQLVALDRPISLMTVFELADD